MNPHYHHPPYPNINSPHSPNSDGGPSNYHGHGPQGGPPNGHLMNSHHDQMHNHPAFTGGPMHHGNGPNSFQNYHHLHHHHHLINHNSNNSNGSDTGSGNQSHMNAMCGGCGHVIKDRWIFKANDQHWHHGCLKCHLCGQFLAPLGSCFTKDSMILCKNDYLKMFGSSGACSRCHQTIPAHEMVMRVGASSVPTSPMNAGYHHVFHLQCFACSRCGNKLVAGDRYYITGNDLVCEQDFLKLIKSSSMPGGPQTAGTTVRKGKVGRPRRSRD